MKTISKMLIASVIVVSLCSVSNAFAHQKSDQEVSLKELMHYVVLAQSGAVQRSMKESTPSLARQQLDESKVQVAELQRSANSHDKVIAQRVQKQDKPIAP